MSPSATHAAPNTRALVATTRDPSTHRSASAAPNLRAASAYASTDALKFAALIPATARSANALMDRGVMTSGNAPRWSRATQTTKIAATSANKTSVDQRSLASCAASCAAVDPAAALDAASTSEEVDAARYWLDVDDADGLVTLSAAARSFCRASAPSA